MAVNSRKRRHSITDKIINNENSKHCSTFLGNDYHYKNYFPVQLMGLMYQLDLSVLQLIRKLTYKHKYPSLSLTFGDSEIYTFFNIVICYNNKSVYIQIENVDPYYMYNGISYTMLFTKEKRSFSINNYFNSFVKHAFSKSDVSLNNIEYLIIYTNSSLDLTEDGILNQHRSKKIYPFKFHRVNLKKCGMLKDFLFTDRSEFFKFSKDETVREELLKQLKFSSSVQKLIKDRKLSDIEIKEFLLDKLVFAVNQPNREELNCIIKNEIGKLNNIQYGYTTLQSKVLRELSAPKNLVPRIIYELNLFMFFLHDMYIHNNIFSVICERESEDISNEIIIQNNNMLIYIMAHTANVNIGYRQLFLQTTKQKQQKLNVFNRHFARFIEISLKKDVKYFLIYTNVDLDLTAENILKQRKSKDFYPLKFDSIDIRKKKYKILRDSSCINENGLYRFSVEESTRNWLLGLLKLPVSLQNDKRFSIQNLREIKEKFLDKIIYAVKQPNTKQIMSIIKYETDNSNKFPYNYEVLHETALRLSESHEFGLITKHTMTQFFEDIETNRFSGQNPQTNKIDDEIKFAKSVVGRDGTLVFDQFLNFLIKERRLEILKLNGIHPANVSSILGGAGANSIKAFKDLNDLWLDEEGNKTRYLKTLEKNGINLTKMSGILSGARANAAKAFKELYDLWFDADGNKTQYLKILEEQGINLSNMCSILGRARANAAEAFKDLYNLWFDKEGNKSQYLKTLEDEGINLTNMSSILCGARSNAAKAFKDLYELWFDEEGNKTQYLKSLEENGINVANMSSILNRAGANAAIVFKELHNLWFDKGGNKSEYLKFLEEEGISLANMSSILNGAGANAAKSFKDLYDLWFDKEGNKTQYIKTLEDEDINLANMSSILNGVGANAAKAFRNLYDLWFDEKGNKTRYLTTLENEAINLGNMSSILCGAGVNAAKAYKGLFDIWFDPDGCKTQYLITLEDKGINLANMSSILGRAGVNAAKAFKDLYNLWFDENGNKRVYLKTLEKKGINLSNISTILHGSGANAPKAFQKLYNTFFDEQGKKQQNLKHFIKKNDEENSFTLHNLSSILSGAGANAKESFQKLYSVCFNDDGEKTEYLDDFYSVGFKPSNLSSMLCGAGFQASTSFQKLHSICFDEKREKTKVLNDFYKAGFRPVDLCNMMSGSVDKLKEFHNFCFVGKTKKYLNNLLNEEEGFTLTDLSEILHGARTNICSALKDFHDVCFDETGSRTLLLDNFYKAGFMSSDLANILSMAGNNAASIFKKFHKSCFKENYLNHFLVHKNLFTPKDLSKIMLHRAGINISSIFQKLHDLCFDPAGNKTNYLIKLSENNRHKMFYILYENVRGSPNFLDDIQEIK